MFSVSSRVDQDNTGTLKRVMGIELIAALCGFPRAAPANYLIDGGAFMPTGAAHPVTAGGSPFGFYSGEMNFYPKN